MFGGRFSDLRSEQEARHLLHSDRIEGLAVQRQMVFLGSKLHDEVALDVVRPLMLAVPLALEGEGARSTV